MRGNGNLIGAFVDVKKTAASGVYDLVDNALFRKNNVWPATRAVVSVTGLSTSIYENSQTTITVSTEGILSNQLIYWKIVNETSTVSDFAIFGGSFTQNASTQTGSFNLITNFIGNPNKATTTFKLQLWFDDPTTGILAYTSPSITILKPTLQSFYWTSTNTPESLSSNLVLQFTNVGDFAQVSFNLVYTGTANAQDFVSLPTTRSQFPGTLTGISYVPVADLTTEGAETLTVELKFGTYTWASNVTLTLSDSSTTPNITITPSTTNITEGQQITFTVTDSNSNNATLYWTITTAGGVSTSDFTGGNLSGSFVLSSGSGTINMTPVADGLTETESFTLQVRSGSTTGTVLATSSTINIIDAAAPSAVWTGDIIPATSTSSTGGPGIFNVWYGRSIISWGYSASELSAAFGKTSATISKMRVYVTNSPTVQPIPSYAIGMKVANGNISSGFTIVKTASSESFTGATYKEFVFTTPFNWNNTDIVIIVAWGHQGGYAQTGTHPIGSGNMYYTRTDNTGQYVINTDTNLSNILTSYRPVVQLYG